MKKLSTLCGGALTTVSMTASGMVGRSVGNNVMVTVITTAIPTVTRMPLPVVAR